MTEFATLDAFDHRILECVRRDNLMPARMLAAQVGLSESAVLRRLRRLRSTGVIVADVAVIDPARLQPSVTIHILVPLHQSNLRKEQAFAGTLYLMAVGAPRWLGAVTPIGGALLIGGWLWFAWSLRGG